MDIDCVVTITALVTNTGDLSGTYDASLKLNNVVAETKSITLASGASQTVSFTTSKKLVGNYTVNIGNASGTFLVKTPGLPEPKKTNWLPIILIVVGGIILIGLVIWLVRRPKKA